jgi:hypothetical protein
MYGIAQDRMNRAGKARENFVSSRHPSLWGGLWLTSVVDKSKAVENDTPPTVETVSPIFQGYEVVRRLVKTGPSYPKTARDNLLNKTSKTASPNPRGLSSDAIVKLPFGRGRLVEGRVWDSVSKEYVPMKAWGPAGQEGEAPTGCDVGGGVAGKKAVGRPQNQVCDQFVVAMEWGRDGKPDPAAPKVDQAERYKSGLAYVHPRDVMFHVPGRLSVGREKKIRKAEQIMKEADALWEPAWQGTPPAADEAFPQAGVANAAKVYLQHIYEAQQQYSIAVEQLHGLVKGRRYPTLGVIKWGEPYATMQKRLLARLYLHLSICTNTLGKDNIEGAVNSAIFYAEQSIGASTGDDPAVEDYARLQLAVAKVERNDKGDLKAATSALRELWSAKGSVLYKKSRNAVLKKLRAMIKGRKERDKKNKDKIGKNFRKATKAGKRFGDDDRGSAKEKGVGGAGAVGPPPLNGVSSILGIPQTTTLPTPVGPVPTATSTISSKKKKKKKKRKKQTGEAYSVSNVLGYGAIAMGVAMICVALVGGGRRGGK